MSKHMLLCTKMAASMSSRKCVRYNFDVAFGTQEEKDAFMDKLRKVHQLLTPPECPTIDNKLFCALFDAVEEVHQQDPSDIIIEHSTNMVVSCVCRYCIFMFLLEGGADRGFYE